MIFRSLVYAILFFGIVNGRLEEKPVTPSDIRKDLFRNYDAKVLPISAPGQRIPTNVSLAPLSISKLDEETEILIMDSWVKMSWIDNQLKWNPSTYGGIESIILPSSEVWKPDISAYTASPDVKLLPGVYTNVIVYYGGTVLWVPPLTLSSRCPLDVKNFPHDAQKCEVVLGSWTYGSKSIDLQLDEDKVGLTDFLDNNPEWSLRQATVHREDKIYPCCPNESYPSIHYEFTLKRKVSSAVCIGDTLATFGVLLALLMFFLHPESSQKIVVGALSLIFLGIISMYVTSAVKAPEAKVKAGERIFLFMTVVAVFLICEIFVVNIAGLLVPRRPAKWLSTTCKFLSQPFSLCFSCSKYEVMNEDNKGSKVHTAREEWCMVATALDRLLLIAAVSLLIVFYRMV